MTVTPARATTLRLRVIILGLLLALFPMAAVSAVPARADAGITQSQHATLGSGGRHMSSTVTWFPTSDGSPSRLVGETTTWNKVKLTGFTGSVVILFKNAEGQTVGHSPVIAPFGVDGRWIGRWSRFDTWQTEVAPDQVQGAVGFEIAHSRGHVDRTEQQVEEAKRWLSLVTIVRTILAA